MNKDTRILGRYARAIFGVALAAGEERTVLDELAMVARVIAADHTLVSLLEHPHVTFEHKVALLVDGCGGGLSARAGHVLELLARRNRLADLPDLVPLVEKLVLDHEGVIRAQVSTAIELADEQKSMIVSRLETVMHKRIEATFKVDPKLIGGIVVWIGDRQIDGSIRHHLQKMESILKSIRVE